MTNTNTKIIQRRSIETATIEGKVIKLLIPKINIRIDMTRIKPDMIVVNMTNINTKMNLETRITEKTAKTQQMKDLRVKMQRDAAHRMQRVQKMRQKSLPRLTN